MQIMKQSLIKGLFLPAIVLCSLLLSGNAALAALVTYSFTGGVSTVSGALLPDLPAISPLAPGSFVTGSFQFDNATGGVGGNYPGAVKTMSLNIGGYTSSFVFGDVGENRVTIFQNTSLGGGLMGDRWNLVTSAMGDATIPNGYTPFRFDLQLDREGGGLFSSTDLVNPPSLSSLTASRWRLMFENSDGSVASVRGALLTLVPLPAAVILFGAGLISLVGLGAGGLRNLRWPQV